MATICVINCSYGEEYCLRPLDGGAPALERVISFAAKIPDCSRLYLLSDASADSRFNEEALKLGRAFKGEFRVVPLPQRTPAHLLSTLEELLQKEDIMVYVYGDTPFLDIEITKKMLDGHQRYFAQYSFADGYPLGITPELLSLSIFPPLKKTAEAYNGEVSRNILFDIIKQDINSYDIETKISPRDMRRLRLELYCDTYRNYLLCDSFARHTPLKAADVMKVCDEHPDLLRTVPVYYQIQITGGCPQACGYCPYGMRGEELLSDTRELSLEEYQRVLQKISDFSKEAVINLSPWGEPGVHSNFPAFINAVDERPGLSLLIETSGIGWTEEALQSVSALAEKGRCKIIQSMDAYTPETYRVLRGPQWEEAQEFAQLGLARLGDSFYLQAVRMESNEKELENFYRERKAEGYQVIIQKYDYFCGRLPQKKLVDLSPLSRFPCWHIKRDMVILIDGTVPLCREDIEGEYPLGNAFEEPLNRIWERGDKIYREHTQGCYRGICEGCDEYYTYNY